MRRAAGGVQADKSRIDDAFEVISVAAAEMAVVDADRGNPALFRLGNRDFSAAIHRDIADIVTPSTRAETGVSCMTATGMRAFLVFASRAIARMRGSPANR